MQNFFIGHKKSAIGRNKLGSNTFLCMNSDHTFWFQITLFARSIYLLCDRSFSFAICSCVYNGISEAWNEVSISEVFSIPYSFIHIGKKFVISDKNTWLMQGMKLLFFSDSHLAPRFFKVVANSKKVCHHFKRQTKPFFYTVNVLDRPSKKVGKRSLTCYKVDTRIDDIQCSSSPKAKIVSSYQSRCVCCVLNINLTRKFAADLSLQIFLIHYISRLGYEEVF